MSIRIPSIRPAVQPVAESFDLEKILATWAEAAYTQPNTTFDRLPAAVQKSFEELNIASYEPQAYSKTIGGVRTYAVIQTSEDLVIISVFDRHGNVLGLGEGMGSQINWRQ